jgi:hypothetical protein
MFSFVATILGIVTFFVLWSEPVKWLVPCLIALDFGTFCHMMNHTKRYGFTPHLKKADMFHMLTTFGSIAIYIYLLIKY